MEIINSVFSWIIKQRIHQMELFIKYPTEVQNDLLLELIKTAKNTEWGKKYDYNNIKTYNDFKNNVPLQDYETLKTDVLRIKDGEQNILWPSEIKWFAKSSGTVTGKSKFIPVSKEALIDCHYKGGKDLLSIYHNNHPESKLILGKVLVVGGSSQINKLNSGSYTGDLSAIIMKNFPFWVEQRRVPNMEVALMAEWEEKIEKMAISTAKEDVSNISGVPSWTLILMQKILEITKANNISEVWPNLEMYMHGGVNFLPYKSQFNKLLGGNHLNYYENYNASEGFFGLQDQYNSDEMLLMLDYGIFYEFIPVENTEEEQPDTLSLEEVKLNKNYEVVISTNSGLWRYRVGDTIKFTSLSPFRIQVTGRTKHFINAFGEELIIENAEMALAMACKKTESSIRDFTVAPIYIDGKKNGRHQWLIEFENEPINLDYFIEILDNGLKSLNSDYEAKRYKNLILTIPEVISLPENTFYIWMKENNKLGGQHKVPRLSNNRNIVDQILKMV
ncbi:GH3 auxin-responsive promoter family protein [Vicingus serpentipes]|uniref:GH3 auxin-responsive promoter family protein n=1 Tax=Vicingus serpentipes TaxID=1926625 RepID=A0A5C6RSQ5_9FLAO|nr:GH3 auxin-responsive promoter family protein [Vicingus serpentipes]TXB65298.1 GH3 auxin-responsive promoter family protein [Vicingus serpentipes]